MSILENINYLHAIVAGIAAFLFAGLWYSPALFAKAWMTENGFTEADLAKPGPAMIKGAISDVILAIFMAILFTEAQMIGKSAILGAIHAGFLGLFIVGAATYPNYVFESRSNKLFLIHIGRTVCGMAIIGAILGGW